jgi:hypothetical protein
MRKKLLNLSVVLASLIGYLEWGKDQSVFLFEAEGQLLSKTLSDPGAVVHTFTVLPLLGQAALVLTLFQKDPSQAVREHRRARPQVEAALVNSGGRQ